MRANLLLALGLALTGIAGQPACADLVVNGNFASNGGVGTSSFAQWLDSDGSILVDNASPAPGDTYDASFTGSGTLSQAVGTTPTQAYTLSFSVLDDSPFFLDTFTVSLGSLTEVVAGTDASSYVTETYTVPAADLVGGDTLAFQGSASFGDWHLDDVSLTQNAIPAPPSGTILAGAVLSMVTLRLRRRAARG
jgi:hypothetical protein